MNVAKVRNLITGSTLYIGANAFASAVSFGLVFVFTRYLSTSDYGITATAYAMQGAIGILIALGLPSAIGREYFEEKPPEEFSNYLGTSMTIVLLWGIVFLVCILLMPSGLTLKIFSVKSWVLIAAGTSAFGYAVYLFQLVLFQMAYKSLAYCALTVLQTVLSGGLGVIAVVGLGLGAEGRVWGIALANVIIAAYALPAIYMHYRMKWGISGLHAKKALHFGLPLLPHDLSGWIIGLADRLLLSNLKNLAVTGTYSAGAALCSPISLIADGVGRAWVPFIFHSLDGASDEQKSELVGIGKLIMLPISLLGVILALFAPEIVGAILPRSYHDAYTVIPLISMTFIASAMYRLFVVPLYHIRKTSAIFVSTTGGAAANVISNLFLIPRYSGIGAAWSWLLALITQLCLSMLLTPKRARLPWGIRFFAPLFCGTCIVLYGSSSYASHSISLRLILLTLFSITMFTPVYFSGTERRILRSSLSFLLGLVRSYMPNAAPR